LAERRIGLVIAPAGSGKSTLLAHFVSEARHPVAWYQAEATEAEEIDLVRHLGHAHCGAIPALAMARMETVDELAAELCRWKGGRATLVVDDLHALAGTPAEAAIERLARYLPAGMVLLAAARRQPAFNLSRLRVSGELLEIGADDLRFRTWEVEQLFRQH